MSMGKLPIPSSIVERFKEAKLEGRKQTDPYLHGTAVCASIEHKLDKLRIKTKLGSRCGDTWMSF